MKKRVSKLNTNIKINSRPISNTETLHPNFSLRELDDKHGFKDLQPKDAKVLLNSLKKMCCFTWRELRNNPKAGISYSTADKTQLKGVSISSLPEDSTVIYFRMNKKGRVFGYRVDKTFYVKWIDPNHKLYN